MASHGREQMTGTCFYRGKCNRNRAFCPMCMKTNTETSMFVVKKGFTHEAAV